MKHISIFFLSFLFLSTAIGQVHPIEVHENNRVASLQMTPTEYSDWKTEDHFNNTAVREALFNDIYLNFADKFDFIFLILNEDEKPDGLPFGQLIQVSNATEGIGLSLFDNSADYGSAGQLMAVMHLTRRDFLRFGPSLHEIVHNWGNFGLDTEALFDTGTELSSFPFVPHWGFTGGSGKGQLGGFDQSTLVDLGAGSYRVESFGMNANGGNSIPYTELELYLMGMIPASDVSDFDIFKDITALEVDGDFFNFDASDRTTFTPASLVTELGTRIPSNTAAQKDFRALTVVLTDAPLTDDQWSLLDEQVELFSRTASDGSSLYNFWEATNGMGTLQMGDLDNTVSVTEFDFSSKIAIYPNPANDLVTIKISDPNITIDAVKLLNYAGQEVANIKPSNGTNSLNFDVSNYPPGVYFLQLKNTDGITTNKKLIIK